MGAARRKGAKEASASRKTGSMRSERDDMEKHLREKNTDFLQGAEKQIQTGESIKNNTSRAEARDHLIDIVTGGKIPGLPHERVFRSLFRIAGVPGIVYDSSYTILYAFDSLFWRGTLRYLAQ